ncbi:MAG: alpha/beta hydrolase [Chloroflexi bacterium]|nr:alpha/beta hydrolase [Chloroflexota bacterium]
MTEHLEGKLSGTAGQLYWRAWRPESPRALVVMMHGFAEHIGRYAHVAEFLTARGYAFYGLDHIGHGQSHGQRGHVHDFGDYLKDLHAFSKLAQSKEPGLPAFLLGHSQGGLMALAYGLTGPSDLRGIIASGAALRLSMPVPAWQLHASRILSRVAPTFSMPSGINSDHLTHDPEVIARYAKGGDPLVFHVASARWAMEFFRAQAETLAGAARFTAPLLMLHGGDDRIASIDAAREFFAAAASRDKTMHVYDGFYHEIFNEIGKEQVLADVAAWLDARV